MDDMIDQFELFVATVLARAFANAGYPCKGDQELEAELQPQQGCRSLGEA